jgi:hypothetical protein
VDFDVPLGVTGFATDGTQHPTEVYRLVSLVVHSGSDNSGHYVTAIRRPGTGELSCRLSASNILYLVSSNMSKLADQVELLDDSRSSRKASFRSAIQGVSLQKKSV